MAPVDCEPGAMLAITTSLVSPGSFTLSLSIALLAGAVLGGLGTLTGALWGALVIVLVPTYVTDVATSHGFSGGVAANKAIRGALQDVAAKAQTTLIIPPPALCTDNGAMIAWAGAERLALGMIDAMDAPPRARWLLDANAAVPAGFGNSRAGF